LKLIEFENDMVECRELLKKKKGTGRWSSEVKEGGGNERGRL